MSDPIKKAVQENRLTFFKNGKVKYTPSAEYIAKRKSLETNVSLEDKLLAKSNKRKNIFDNLLREYNSLVKNKDYFI